ncbi:MAG: tryptophan-rich sensory protein [Clostridia bacterium]|nr:tryptophan-rich sensory protein [Clostridia bacterium]
MKKEIKAYAVSIAAALAVGGISALLTAGNMDIYSEIIKPPLAPPSVLFPIVWTLLYILMGVSAAMVYLQREENPTAARNSLAAYGVSLFLNFFWSIIFFNMQAFLFSFIWLVLLWISILITILQYRKISPLAAALQVPYLLWVTFAGYLNLAIFLLNM